MHNNHSMLLLFAVFVCIDGLDKVASSDYENKSLYLRKIFNFIISVNMEAILADFQQEQRHKFHASTKQQG